MDGSGRTRGESRTPEFVTVPLDRRRFLLMLAGAAVGAAVTPRLAAAIRHAAKAPGDPWALPDALPAEPLEAARALIAAAILAPSYWNAQPWRFEVDGASLRLTLDASRTLPVCDPDERFAQISLGAALENLLVAARAWGVQPAVRYLPWGIAARKGAPFVAASVSWENGEGRRDRELFAAIPHRRSNPRHYDGRAIAMSQRTQLLAQVPEELGLHWLEDRADIRAVARIVHDAVAARSAAPAAQRERYRWLRLGDSDERRGADGVTPDRLNLTGPLGWLEARALSPGSRAFGWAAASLAHEAEDAARTAGAFALLTAPKRTDSTYLLAGQAYERLALRATALGIAQQPLAAPIESEHHRVALAKRFGAGSEEPLLLVRLGHAHTVAPTARRAVALVSTYRTS